MEGEDRERKQGVILPEQTCAICDHDALTQLCSLHAILSPLRYCMEADLEKMGMPMVPRRKLMEVIYIIALGLKDAFRARFREQLAAQTRV